MLLLRLGMLASLLENSMIDTSASFSAKWFVTQIANRSMGLLVVRLIHVGYHAQLAFLPNTDVNGHLG